MSDQLWDEVRRLCDSSRESVFRDRSVERVRRTAEIFTPTPLVIDLLRNVPRESFAPGKKVLDPACGDGQFLSAVKFAKIVIWGQSEEAALEDLFGIDIVAENVLLCRLRLGGGTIVIGDALNPSREVEGQTDHDRNKLEEIVGIGALTLF